MLLKSIHQGTINDAPHSLIELILLGDSEVWVQVATFPAKDMG